MLMLGTPLFLISHVTFNRLSSRNKRSLRQEFLEKNQSSEEN